MKKRFFGFWAALCLLLVLACPAFAAEEEAFDPDQIPFDAMVWDNAGILSEDEAAELDLQAWKLTQEFRCGVYIVTISNLAGIDVEAANQFILDEYGLGYGPDQSCVILLLAIEERKFDIMAHGYGNIAFTDYGKEQMQERFLDEFREDDWYGGFTEYLSCCGEYLQLARRGEPFDVGDSEPSVATGLAIGILVPLLIALVVCSIFKSQMKTAKMQEAAQFYIGQQGMVLSRESDHFLYTTRTEQYIKPSESSSGGGTTVDDSGSSHSSGSF